MTTRLTITLEPSERNALDELSINELRDPRDQIKIILRRELIRLGLLNQNSSGEANDTSTEDDTEHDKGNSSSHTKLKQHSNFSKP